MRAVNDSGITLIKLIKRLVFRLVLEKVRRETKLKKSEFFFPRGEGERRGAAARRKGLEHKKGSYDNVHTIVQLLMCACRTEGSCGKLPKNRGSGIFCYSTRPTTA